MSFKIQTKTSTSTHYYQSQNSKSETKKIDVTKISRYSGSALGIRATTKAEIDSDYDLKWV